ncbi:MAG: hypothetical protein R8K54_05445 [Mariprofundaceae bacterium]
MSKDIGKRELTMFVKQAKEEKVETKADSKVTRTVSHTFPRPLFTEKHS